MIEVVSDLLGMANWSQSAVTIFGLIVVILAVVLGFFCDMLMGRGSFGPILNSLGIFLGSGFGIVAYDRVFGLKPGVVDAGLVCSALAAGILGLFMLALTRRLVGSVALLVRASRRRPVARQPRSTSEVQAAMQAAAIDRALKRGPGRV